MHWSFNSLAVVAISGYLLIYAIGTHPEPDIYLHMLYVLYAGVFWRGEAPGLEI